MGEIPQVGVRYKTWQEILICKFGEKRNAQNIYYLREYLALTSLERWLSKDGRNNARCVEQLALAASTRTSTGTHWHHNHFQLWRYKIQRFVDFVLQTKIYIPQRQWFAPTPTFPITPLHQSTIHFRCRFDMSTRETSVRHSWLYYHTTFLSLRSFWRCVKKWHISFWDRRWRIWMSMIAHTRNTDADASDWERGKLLLVRWFPTLFSDKL